MIEKFTNRYPLDKTLRFSLVPIGETEKHFNEKLLLQSDTQRAEDYKKVKGYLDEYFKVFIEDALSCVTLEGIEDYAALYNKSNKSKNEQKEMTRREATMRKAIATALTKDERYSFFTEHRSKLITTELPNVLSNEEVTETSRSFDKFTTYFTGFFTNRENMFSAEEKSTAISYRCINENLPRFIDNVKSFEKVRESLPGDNIDELNESFSAIYATKVEDIFTLKSFPSVLPQSGITRYNEYIGGYSKDDGSKIQGLNEYINLYNQQIAKSDKSKRLPLMKPLYKQILSDRESASFIPEAFVDDNELLRAVNRFYALEDGGAISAIDKLTELIKSIVAYNADGIYVSSAYINDLSRIVYSDWATIKEKWEAEYECEHKIGKNKESYYKKLEDEYKSIKSFSLNALQSLCGNEISISNVLENKVIALRNAVVQSFDSAAPLLTNEYAGDRKLAKNDEAIERIKELLDAIKEFERFAKMLVGTGKEVNKDNAFYGEFLPALEALKSLDNLYNKVRNYLTQKPYSTDKIKLNFENPQLLGGWDVNKESDYRTVLLRKSGMYYLAIMDKTNNRIFEDAPISHSDNYEKMICKQISDVAKYFSIKQIGPQNPPENIRKYLEKGFDKKTMSKQQLTELVKYVAEDFIPNYNKIQDENGNCYFDFKIKKYEDYTSWMEFLNDLKPDAYTVKFTDVSAAFVEQMICEGKLYLFRIYNKDFSDYSKGKQNLHTLYFKMLFDEKNLKNVVYKLSGGAEMFYRYPSLKETETTIHHANESLKNKNPDNPKKQSKFAYDLIKDKRFTKRQFSLHIPIQLNFKATDSANINMDVREALKSSDKHHVIGIDRGERNLIYVSVIDETGKIILQKSFNIIESDNNHKVNYHDLLERKAKERDKARKSWSTIENIKELKEGYISQVVHEICKLVVKYDAIIALEDLNGGFKNSRKKVDKQVYQKFENMLVSKLQYLTDKSLEPEALGGLLNAYQLTESTKRHSATSRQNGIIFYVPAWLTSKIDPVTGFVDLLKPKYKSVAASIDFISKFDDIRYNRSENIFEFLIDYTKFPKTDADYKKKWIVCTNGTRIRNFRDAKKNNEWSNETIVLTEEFIKLFDDAGIDYSTELKKKILQQNEAKFFGRLLKLIALTLQMRNSETGNVDVDYLLSPVKNDNGVFYDSRNYTNKDALPCDADANGAYNIARKALWAINQLKQSDDLKYVKLSITNKEWLEYTQKL